MHLDKTLKELGFSEKEAKVYLASLELGPHPVQDISRRASVNRATTYVMIESLTARGMMSSFEKGKKRFFTAEHPDRLFNLLKDQQKEIKEKEDLINKMMPDLMAINAGSESQPRVRFFEGIEGAHAIQQDIVESKVDSIEHIVDLDEYRKHFSDDDFPEHRAKLKKAKISFKGLITTNGEPPAGYDTDPTFKNYKFIDKEIFSFPGEIVIYGNKVAIFTYKGKAMGVIIENPEINQMISTMFNLAYNAV